MPDYPAYHATVAEVPEYVAKVIEQSRIYEVAYDDALAAAQKALDEYHTGRFGNPDRDPYDIFIEHAVSELDPYKIGPLVDSAHTTSYRAAMTLWARAGGYKASDVLNWFNRVIREYRDLDHVPYSRKIWDEFHDTFPIEMPRNAEGKVDSAALSEMEMFQRAILTAQSAEVAQTCATGGGDDTWFDYLPAGIRTLSALQAEDWAEVFAEYMNTVSVIEDEDEKMDAEIAFDEAHDLYIMDVTTPLLTRYL